MALKLVQTVAVPLLPGESVNTQGVLGCLSYDSLVVGNGVLWHNVVVVLGTIDYQQKMLLWETKTGALNPKYFVTTTVAQAFLNSVWKEPPAFIYGINSFNNIVSVQLQMFPPYVIIGRGGNTPDDFDPPIIFDRCIGMGTQIGTTYGSNLLRFYDEYDRETGKYLLTHTMVLPDQLEHICRENNESIWIVTKNGVVAKINTTLYRYEMISTLQNTGDDKFTRIAWGEKNKQLLVLRVSNAANNPWRVELYQPIYQAKILTDPVPVSPLRAGETVRFISHLIGDAGEGVASYLINAELQDPAVGEVRTPMSGAELNGAATFRYRSEEPGEDTLQLNLTVGD